MPKALGREGGTHSIVNWCETLPGKVDLVLRPWQGSLIGFHSTSRRNAAVIPEGKSILLYAVSNWPVNAQRPVIGTRALGCSHGLLFIGGEWIRNGKWEIWPSQRFWLCLKGRNPNNTTQIATNMCLLVSELCSFTNESTMDTQVSEHFLGLVTDSTCWFFHTVEMNDQMGGHNIRICCHYILYYRGTMDI
jgi:hypothetical protein